jgi:hypothetical protein
MSNKSKNFHTFGREVSPENLIDMVDPVKLAVDAAVECGEIKQDDGKYLNECIDQFVEDLKYMMERDKVHVEGSEYK